MTNKNKAEKAEKLIETGMSVKDAAIKSGLKPDYLYYYRSAKGKKVSVRTHEKTTTAIKRIKATKSQRVFAVIGTVEEVAAMLKGLL